MFDSYELKHLFIPTFKTSYSYLQSSNYFWIRRGNVLADLTRKKTILEDLGKENYGSTNLALRVSEQLFMFSMMGVIPLLLIKLFTTSISKIKTTFHISEPRQTSL